MELYCAFWGCYDLDRSLLECWEGSHDWSWLRFIKRWWEMMFVSLAFYTLHDISKGRITILRELSHTMEFSVLHSANSSLRFRYLLVLNTQLDLHHDTHCSSWNVSWYQWPQYRIRVEVKWAWYWHLFRWFWQLFSTDSCQNRSSHVLPQNRSLPRTNVLQRWEFWSD